MQLVNSFARICCLPVQELVSSPINNMLKAY